MIPKLVYVTGAPATGKSTLTRSFGELHNEARTFIYSKELANYVSNKVGAPTSQDDLREKSSILITRKDVNDVDDGLLELARELRGKQSLIVDSHPVTIEPYGFRVTAFTKEQLTQLSPDIVVCLYADAEVLSQRIKADSAGRPLPTPMELTRHVQLQCHIAAMYAFETGASLYYLDANKPQVEVLSNFLKVTGYTNNTI